MRSPQLAVDEFAPTAVTAKSTSWVAHNRADLRKRRIGFLDVVGFYGVNRSGQALWVLACSCGRRLIRTQQSLRVSAGRSEFVTCRKCRVQRLEHARKPTKRQMRFQAYLLEYWDKHKSLYPSSDLDERIDWGSDASPTADEPVPEEKPPTYREIANAFAADGDPVSVQYVQQLEASALAKLRKSPHAKELARALGIRLPDAFAAYAEPRAERAFVDSCDDSVNRTRRAA